MHRFLPSMAVLGALCGGAALAAEPVPGCSAHSGAIVPHVVEVPADVGTRGTHARPPGTGAVAEETTPASAGRPARVRYLSISVAAAAICPVRR